MKTIFIGVIAVIGIIIAIMIGLNANTNLEEIGTDDSVQLEGNSNVDTYKIMIEPLPENIDEKMILGFLNESTSYWEQKNPELNFIYDDKNPDIIFSWSLKGYQDHIGFASLNAYGFYQVQISLGDKNCRGYFIQFTDETIKNTMMHEIGHVLGLLHTSDEKHLMWSDDEFVQEVFDEKGLVIPSRLDDKFLFSEAKELYEEYDVISKDFEVFESDYKMMKEKLNTLQTQYEYYGTEDLYSKIQELRVDKARKYGEYLAAYHNIQDLAWASECIPVELEQYHHVKIKTLEELNAEFREILKDFPQK